MSGSESDKEKQLMEAHVHPITSIAKEQIGDRMEVITSVISPSGKEIKVTGDVDEAMGLALEAKGVQIDEETNKRILRKIDLYLMPLICLTYGIQFMDKVSSSSASIMGLKTDLHMVGDMYSWVGSSFYLGYLIFVFPASTILQRFPLAKVTAIFISVWGAVLCLLATPNYAGFIFLRTFLGLLESAITPAMVILTSQWYKKEEQFIRTSIWFSFNGFGSLFGSAIAYGVLVHQDKYALEGWKINFIIIGLITVLLGFAIFLHIPDTPASAWFLTKEEKILVVERIRTNNQGFGNKHFKMEQFKEALLDYRTWLFFFFAIASNIPNGGITNFSSILLNSDFGYTVKKSFLMNMPSGGVELIGCSLFGLLHKYAKHRLAIAVASMILTLIASCMLAFANDSKNARLAGFYLLSIAPVGMICCLSCFSSNVAGHTKKITVNALYLIAYCAGNIIGPQTFVETEAPSYKSAKLSIVICYVVTVVLLAIVYWSYWFDNKKRDQKKERGDYNEYFMENQEFADLTDKQNPHFRYAL